MKLTTIFILIAVGFTQTGCNQKNPKSPAFQNETSDRVVKPADISSQKDQSGTDTPSKEPIVTPDLKILSGIWKRMDGGYELHLSDIKADGLLNARYFNPNPIHVESTKWEFTNNYLYVMVKLQDVNYPGSTYTLQYFPEADKLAGVYYQAMEGNNYDVVFERTK